MSLSSGFASKKQEILYSQIIFKAFQIFQDALLHHLEVHEGVHLSESWQKKICKINRALLFFERCGDMFALDTTQRPTYMPPPGYSGHLRMTKESHVSYGTSKFRPTKPTSWPAWQLFLQARQMPVPFSSVRLQVTHS